MIQRRPVSAIEIPGVPTGRLRSTGQAARIAKREVTSGTLAGTPNPTPDIAFALKPSSSVAAELDRDAFRTDPHDMCPRWFGCGWIWRPEHEQRTQSVDGNEIDAAQVDDQYAAVPHQPSGVRAHVVYVGRVDLAADGDHGEFGIVADPYSGSAAIDDCRAVLTWRMVNVIVPSNHVQAFASLAGVAEWPSTQRGLETQTPLKARRTRLFTPTPD
jgi:hypothetical protein